MKSIKFSTRIYKQIKSKNQEINNLEEGITKVLQEKYKPKVLCNIETLSEKKVQRGVA
ncbi:hypothetical protein [Prochlorococcus sp. MIT 0801]|uniref:hypothetical protein n=1 Tax=Prochlorococcus sp. MIT 0801 TaxID=1501269 RepID=UPI0004F87F30|nr:hypothetical protein [Prochlorococcus sp. MIT 0801]AIQ97775.1 hypothetical protein EW15_1683 [Prochlorococcus sp. MIT 0801]